MSVRVSQDDGRVDSQDAEQGGPRDSGSAGLTVQTGEGEGFLPLPHQRDSSCRHGDTLRTDTTGCPCFSASFSSVHFYGLRRFHICSLPTPPCALFFEHILR